MNRKKVQEGGYILPVLIVLILIGAGVYMLSQKKEQAPVVIQNQQGQETIQEKEVVQNEERTQEAEEQENQNSVTLPQLPQEPYARAECERFVAEYHCQEGTETAEGLVDCNPQYLRTKIRCQAFLNGEPDPYGGNYGRESVSEEDQDNNREVTTLSTYHDPRMGIEFSYPQSWEIAYQDLESVGRDGETISLATSFREGNEEVMNVTYYESTDSSQMIWSYVQGQNHEVRHYPWGDALVVKERITRDGRGNPIAPVERTTLYHMRGVHLYRITFRDSYPPTREDTFNQILESVRFF